MTITRLYDGLEEVENAYARALVAIWREATAADGPSDFVTFEKSRLDFHGDQLVKAGLGVSKRRGRRIRDEGDSEAVQNRPDIIYTFRARADLPDEIERHGPYAILGRGKGRYAFVRIHRPNRISVPVDPPLVELNSHMPAWAARYMGQDEQAMLVNIQLNGLVSHHLNLRAAFLLQPHVRLFVAGYGQVELDAVYIGETRDGRHVGIGVDAKPNRNEDRHNIAQLYSDGLALLRRLFPGLPCRMLAAKPTGQGEFLMCEFNASENVTEVNEINGWVKYRMRVEN